MKYIRRALGEVVPETPPSIRFRTPSKQHLPPLLPVANADAFENNRGGSTAASALFSAARVGVLLVCLAGLMLAAWLLAPPTGSTSSSLVSKIQLPNLGQQHRDSIMAAAEQPQGQKPYLQPAVQGWSRHQQHQQHQPQHQQLPLMQEYSPEEDVVRHEDGCVDENPHCPGWARLNECLRNSKFMLASCRLSCGTCSSKPAPQPPKLAPSSHPPLLQDVTFSRDRAKIDTDHGGAPSSPVPVPVLVPVPVPVPMHAPSSTGQSALSAARMPRVPVAPPSSPSATKPGATKMAILMAAVPTSGSSGDLSCTDRHPRCAEFVASGECTRNEQFMRIKCLSSCGWCETKGRDADASGT